MATFLINASNLKNGGGLQVAQSICGELKRFKEHRFIVVLSTFVNVENIEFDENADLYRHNIGHDLNTVLWGRDGFLDGLAGKYMADAVLTVFGPSLWQPRVPHLCGFARAQLVLPNINVKHNIKWLKEKLVYWMWDWAFRRSSDTFYTENEFISRLLHRKYKDVKVYTVSNYYNQVFDLPAKWKRSIKLPYFDGVTCLSVSSPSSHKNFGIIEGIVRYLRESHPGFKVRFVLTFNSEAWPMAEDVRESIVYIGKVDVSECPSLYEQSDIMFMPTLLECFTATYPEAMRMEVPIVTTDLEFAHGLCGEAACYYSAMDAKAAGEAIYKVATEKDYRLQLTTNGKEQLKKFDNYEQRAEKLLYILETMCGSRC